MDVSADYSQLFFDIQTAAPERRAACEADFLNALIERLGRLGANGSAAEATARLLWAHMVEPGRHYHTPVHVLSMACWARRLGAALSDADALALWFHDAVWQADAQGDANERASAACLGEQAHQLGLDADVTAEAMQAIRWTARHTETTVPERYALVMDLDLAGFASEPHVFAAQSKAVRAELSAVDDRAFAAGTVRLFQALLSRERIYRTEAAAAMEAPARRNLHREVERLRAAAAQP